MTFHSALSLLYLEVASTAISPEVSTFEAPACPGLQCVSAASPLVANKAALACKSEWILLMQNGAVPHPASLDRVSRLSKAHPDVDVFVPLHQPNDVLELGPQSICLHTLCSSGLLIRKSFLIEIEGFNESCAGYVDAEFLARCLKGHASRMRAYPVNRLVRITDPTYAFLGGVDRVLKATHLFKRELGESPPVWFVDYASAVMQRVGVTEGSTISLTMAQDHLCKLASRIDYWVSHSGQVALGSYLNRSVYEGNSPLGTRQIDRAVSRIFPNKQKGCALPNTFKAFSVGSFCHSAQVLKELTLRRQTGPLDWIFTNLRATTHMFETNFDMLLDPRNCETAREEDKVDPHSNVAHNVFYRDQFGVKFMYNHHDLNRPDHLRLFQQGAADLLAALNSSDPTFLLLVTLHKKDCDNIKDLADNIHKRGKNNLLLVVCLEHQESDEEESGLALQHHPELNTYVAVLKTASRSNGMEFPLEVDNLRLRRLVHGVAFGCFASKFQQVTI